MNKPVLFVYRKKKEYKKMSRAKNPKYESMSCLLYTSTMKIEYTKVGDYYLPNLYYPEETRPIGLWGMLRKE